MTPQKVSLTFIKDVTLDTGRAQATTQATVTVTANIVDLRIILVDACRDGWILVKLDHINLATSEEEQ